MKSWVRGLHHVTGAVGSAQRDYDFYTGTLGLRLVKRTVNHENPKYWHFFYGDHDGNAGTIMTNFIFPNVPLPPYRRGRGSLSEVAYSVPQGSLDFWSERLRAAGSSIAERSERFGDEVLPFADPAGIPSELIACEDGRAPRPAADIGLANVVRGFHSITAISRIPELTLDFFTRLLRFAVVGKEGNRTRLEVGDGGPGTYVDLLAEPDAPWGVWGMGGLHHVAFTMESKEQMEQLWQVLGGAGLILTDLRDRLFFHSMYMTEPGGINVEFSNLTPGWTVDEPFAELGTRLSLPKQWEAQRADIERNLEPLTF